MPAEDHFINRGLLKVKVNDFLRRELRRAGYAGVDLQKTPLGMRVVVYASRPGMVIGRRGITVRELTETLEHDFGLEAPQIEVNEVEVPELNGSIMAERLAQRLERGDHFRRAAYGVLRRIIGAGAKGVEISISGKLTSRRARYQKFRSGFVAKTGEPIRTAVSHGWAFAVMKPGVLGVQVRIMLPDAVAPDRPVIVHREVEVPVVPVVPAVPAPPPEGAEIEIVEEELPIEEAPSIEEFVEEGAEPVPESIEPEVPVMPEVEPSPEPSPEPTPEEAPPVEEKPEPEKPKPKAKPKKEPEVEPPKEKAPEKPKEKPKPKKEVAEKKPKAKKEKVEAKPKVKPKAKAKAEPKEKAAAEKKPKAKAKPEATKAEEKPKAKAKATKKPKTKKAAEKEKKAKPKASKEKASKSKKESSKK